MSDGLATTAYQVLARKYRPGHFRDLIGQEAMVATLTNAFAHDRIAHAFIMTGVRGVGKTTTARIVAKGLNCERDGRPTVDPCGTCETCLSIAEGRNVDVLEMDAASHTGVGDMREIIDAVRYRAATARYKVYIIDEVHMLSNSAFNALLKTLEEPPEHVKFIFATTEIRKVPVTVLSRCQRFDLRRIEPETMIEHLSQIARKEDARISSEALALIARASEGSVRDALSLLDQAIARASAEEVQAAEVRTMLGLADRGRVFDLFEAVMRGDASAALEDLGRQYSDGADPGAVLKDLAELTHWLSVLKISTANADDPTISPDERTRGTDLAARLSMRVLTRTWQMLLKAMEELAQAPNAMMAAEMAIIRLTHVADLPPPEDLVRRLSGETAPPSGTGRTGSSGPANGPTAALKSVVGGIAETVPQPAAAPNSIARLSSFEDAMALIRESRNPKLVFEIENHVQLVRYRPGIIEFHPTPDAPADLAGRLSTVLRSLTGTRWGVSISEEPGAPTIAATERSAETVLLAEAELDPLVIAARKLFPGLDLKLGASPTAPPAAGDYLTSVPEGDGDDDLLDDDDPFEEDL